MRGEFQGISSQCSIIFPFSSFFQHLIKCSKRCQVCQVGTQVLAENPLSSFDGFIFRQVSAGERLEAINQWLFPALESLQLAHYALEAKAWCLKLGMRVCRHQKLYSIATRLNRFSFVVPEFFEVPLRTTTCLIFMQIPLFRPFKNWHSLKCTSLSCAEWGATRLAVRNMGAADWSDVKDAWEVFAADLQHLCKTQFWTSCKHVRCR